MPTVVDLARDPALIATLTLDAIVALVESWDDGHHQPPTPFDGPAEASVIAPLRAAVLQQLEAGALWHPVLSALDYWDVAEVVPGAPYGLDERHEPLTTRWRSLMATGDDEALAHAARTAASPRVLATVVAAAPRLTGTLATAAVTYLADEAVYGWNEVAVDALGAALERRLDADPAAIPPAVAAIGALVVRAPQLNPIGLPLLDRCLHHASATALAPLRATLAEALRDPAWRGEYTEATLWAAAQLAGDSALAADLAAAPDPCGPLLSLHIEPARWFERWRRLCESPDYGLMHGASALARLGDEHAAALSATDWEVILLDPTMEPGVRWWAEEHIPSPMLATLPAPLRARLLTHGSRDLRERLLRGSARR